MYDTITCSRVNKMIRIKKKKSVLIVYIIYHDMNIFENAKNTTRMWTLYENDENTVET